MLASRGNSPDKNKPAKNMPVPITPAGLKMPEQKWIIFYSGTVER
ncbi:MAG: hypothetical protein ACI8ZB_004816 [Desulforhopalus sp.]